MTVDRPRVSFVISCHSYGRYLKTAIDSLIAQGIAATEIVVVDDASADETAGVLRDHGADPRIVVIRHAQRHGHLRSNNEGLALARGEYVGVFDADDFLLTSDAVRRQLEVFDRNPRVGFVYSSYLLVD
jgi:glycosyltransferase involved in cell wall biosynthesis